jgi:hypothetical protein
VKIIAYCTIYQIILNIGKLFSVYLRHQQPNGINKMTKANTQQAKTFGAIAFANNINASVLDKNFTDMLAGRQIGDKRNIPEMKAWIAGWTEAQVAN